MLSGCSYLQDLFRSININIFFSLIHLFLVEIRFLTMEGMIRLTDEVQVYVVT